MVSRKVPINKKLAYLQKTVDSIDNLKENWSQLFQINNKSTNLSDNHKLDLFHCIDYLSSFQLKMNQQPESPNQQIIYNFDLQQSKEALSRKFPLRPTKEELVAHGILPSSRVPTQHYYEQKRLQKAKIQDFLKKKVEQRPDREQLVQKNILSESKAAPALHESQRQLKRARLVDDLNDKLLHRPGPLELVEHGILVPDNSLTEAIKDGKITFPRLSETTFKTTRFYFDDLNRSISATTDNDDNDSNSSTGLNHIYSSNASPLNLNDCPTPGGTCTNFGDLFISVPSPNQSTLLAAPMSSCSSTDVTNSIIDSISNSTAHQLKYSNSLQPYELPKVQTDGGGKIKKPKSNKKNGMKKVSQLIFHEYKGPNQKSSVSKTSVTHSSSVSLTEDESARLNSELDPYKIRLEQQKMLLLYGEKDSNKQISKQVDLVSPNASQIQVLPLDSLPNNIRELISNQLQTITTQQQQQQEQKSPNKFVAIQPQPAKIRESIIEETKIDLEALSKNQLIDECKRRGIPSSGRNKQRLIADIKAHMQLQNTIKIPDSGVQFESSGENVDEEKAKIQRQIEELNRKLNELNSKSTNNETQKIQLLVKNENDKQQTKRVPKQPQQKINQMLKQNNSAPSQLNQIISTSDESCQFINFNASSDDHINCLPSISSLIINQTNDNEPQINNCPNSNNQITTEQMEWNDADLMQWCHELQTNDGLLNLELDTIHTKQQNKLIANHQIQIIDEYLNNHQIHVNQSQQVNHLQQQHQQQQPLDQHYQLQNEQRQTFFLDPISLPWELDSLLDTPLV